MSNSIPPGTIIRGVCGFQLGKQGWSEVWYRPFGAGFDAAIQSLRTYLVTRQNFQSPNVNNVFIRVSDASGNRKSRLLTLAGNDFNRGDSVTAGNASSEAYESLLVRCLCANDAKKNWMIAGLPDSFINSSFAGDYNFGSATVNKIQTSFNRLMADGWGMLQKTGAGPPPTFAQRALVSMQIRRPSSRRRGRVFDVLPGRRFS